MDDGRIAQRRGFASYFFDRCLDLSATVTTGVTSALSPIPKSSSQPSEDCFLTGAGAGDRDRAEPDAGAGANVGVTGADAVPVDELETGGVPVLAVATFSEPDPETGWGCANGARDRVGFGTLSVIFCCCGPLVVSAGAAAVGS